MGACGPQLIEKVTGVSCFILDSSLDGVGAPRAQGAATNATEVKANDQGPEGGRSEKKRGECRKADSEEGEPTRAQQVLSDHVEPPPGDHSSARDIQTRHVRPYLTPRIRGATLLGVAGRSIQSCSADGTNSAQARVGDWLRRAPRSAIMDRCYDKKIRCVDSAAAILADTLPQ